MIRVTQLGYLGLSVSDLDGWERFSTEILGLQSNGKDDDGALFQRMDEYHHRFIVHPTGQDDLAYVGWEVADDRALEGLAGQLKAAGTEVRPGTPQEIAARRVQGLIRFADPTGIASEAYWGPRVCPEEPFRSPRPISGFQGSEQGLGHFVLAVDDFSATLSFYRDVLGFRVSDYIQLPVAPEVRLKLCFLHCNRRHHTIAFAEMPPVPKRMNHFLLQLNSLDDVGETYYRCQERNVPMALSLGRHSNDRMVSFYMMTPPGFAVEYGWGAREVDDADWQIREYMTGSVWGHQPVS